jgi:molybdopterin converting factor small subunit
MPIRVLIPTALRAFTAGQTSVEVDGRTVGEVLASLTARHGELRKHLYDEQGKLRSFVNVYVNDEDARYLQRENTPLGERDVVSIVPSIAGGQGRRDR